MKRRRWKASKGKKRRNRLGPARSKEGKHCRLEMKKTKGYKYPYTACDRPFHLKETRNHYFARAMQRTRRIIVARPSVGQNLASCHFFPSSPSSALPHISVTYHTRLGTNSVAVIPTSTVTHIVRDPHAVLFFMMSQGHDHHDPCLIDGDRHGP